MGGILFREKLTRKKRQTRPEALFTLHACISAPEGGYRVPFKGTVKLFFYFSEKDTFIGFFLFLKFWPLTGSKLQMIFLPKIKKVKMTFFDFRQKNSTVILSTLGDKFKKKVYNKVFFSEKSKNNFTVPLRLQVWDTYIKINKAYQSTDNSLSHEIIIIQPIYYVHNIMYISIEPYIRQCLIYPTWFGLLRDIRHASLSGKACRI